MKLTMVFVLICAAGLLGCDKNDATNAPQTRPLTTAPAPATKPWANTPDKPFTPKKVNAHEWTADTKIDDVDGDIQKIVIYVDSGDLQHVNTEALKYSDTIHLTNKKTDAFLGEQEVWKDAADATKPTKVDVIDDGETFTFKKGDASFDAALQAVKGDGLKIRFGTKQPMPELKVVSVSITYIPNQSPPTR